MKVWVELDPITGVPIRIFRNKKAAVLYSVNPNRGLAPEPLIRYMEKAVATQAIRTTVFFRDDFKCVRCGEDLTWKTAEMDEKQARGEILETVQGQYQGGEVSVANGQTLCQPCHTSGPNAKHNRNPRWTK